MTQSTQFMTRAVHENSDSILLLTLAVSETNDSIQLMTEAKIVRLCFDP